MRVCSIIQARQGSTRLPGKALVDVCGKPAIQRVVERLRRAKTLDDVIVAMPTSEADDRLEEFCILSGYSYYRGSEDNVLLRVLEAARQFDVDCIVEITADLPLLDWNHVDALVEIFMEHNCDHVSNIITRTFPRGYDIRVFSREALERTYLEVDNDVDRSHVSTWQYLNPKGKLNYKCLNMIAPLYQDRPELEITLDTPEDLELIRWIYGFESQGYNLELTCEEVIGLIDTYPSMYEKVAKITRKDYFTELSECYAKQLEDRIINGDPSGIKEPMGIFNTLEQNIKPIGKKRGRPKK
jgi:spore coat polysaccharide biosynthesis protein SpsF